MLQFRETAGSVPHTNNFNQSTAILDPVHDAARSANYLSDLGIVKLGNDASGLGKGRKAFNRVE
jgi:hypothetical protein